MRRTEIFFGVLSLVGACAVLLVLYIACLSNCRRSCDPAVECAHSLVGVIGKEAVAWEAGYDRNIYEAISAIRRLASRSERLALLEELSEKMLMVQVENLRLESRVSMALDFWSSYYPIAYAQLKEDESDVMFENFLRRYWDLFYILCHPGLISEVPEDSLLRANIRWTYQRKLRDCYRYGKEQFESVELRRVSNFASLSPTRQEMIFRCWREIKKSIDERDMNDTAEVRN